MKYANSRRRVIEKAPGSHLLTWNTLSKEQLKKLASPSVATRVHINENASEGGKMKNLLMETDWLVSNSVDWDASRETFSYWLRDSYLHGTNLFFTIRKIRIAC